MKLISKWWGDKLCTLNQQKRGNDGAIYKEFKLCL